MKAALILFLVLISLPGFAQTYHSKDFFEMPGPKAWTNLYSATSPSKDSYKVEMVKGKLTIMQAPKSSVTADYQIADGLLWTINEGEFGGVMYYMPKDTSLKYITVNGRTDTLKDYSKSYYANRDIYPSVAVKERLKKSRQFEIFEGNINYIFKYRDSIYFAEGLAHMSLNTGAVYKLDYRKPSVTITKVADLHGEPEAILVDHDNLFIATFDKFFAFNKWKKIVELDNLFWQALYPASIAFADKHTVYVGHRGGYSKIDLKTQKLTFFRSKIFDTPHQ